MLTLTLTLVIVCDAATAMPLVMPVVLLSGIASPGLAAYVSTWFPPPPDGCTESDTVVACDSAPLVPVRVKVYVPVGVDAAVATFSVEPAEPPEGGVTGFGANEAVAPDGRPLTDSVVAALKPLTLVTVAV